MQRGTLQEHERAARELTAGDQCRGQTALVKNIMYVNLRGTVQGMDRLGEDREWAWPPPFEADRRHTNPLRRIA